MSRKVIILLVSIIFAGIFAGCALLQNEQVYTVHTTAGEFTLRLFDGETPRHSERFQKFANGGLYDSTLFHRVVPGFVIQTGDPGTKLKSTPKNKFGTGGSGTTVDAEFSKHLHQRGSVAMARGPGIHSADSQWYICLKDLPHLDSLFTVFGEVIDGMDTIDSIASVPTDIHEIPLSEIRIDSISFRSLHEFRKEQRSHE